MLASSAEVLPMWFSMLEFIELMATLYVRTLALIGAGKRNSIVQKSKVPTQECWRCFYGSFAYLDRENYAYVGDHPRGWSPSFAWMVATIRAYVGQWKIKRFYRTPIKIIKNTVRVW